MDKGNFKLNLKVKSGITEVDEYIDKLHEHILSFNASSIKKIILALDNIAEDIADDLNLISTGDTWVPDVIMYNSEGKEEKKICGYSKLKVLSDESSSKVFDRVMVLIKNVNDFKAVAKLAEELVPEIEDIKESKSKAIQIDLKGGNVFESILKSQTSK